MPKLTNCMVCNKELTGKQRMFCSNICKCKTSNNKHQNYQAQRKRGYKRKRQLISEKGGKCESCGYNKNIAALCFHHTNPEEKSFRLDIRNLSNRNAKTIAKEAEKCILLCVRCHAEIHNPDANTAYLDT